MGKVEGLNKVVPEPVFSQGGIPACVALERELYSMSLNYKASHESYKLAYYINIVYKLAY